MIKYSFSPRVMEAINVTNDMELFTSIIIRKRVYVKLVYTTCYMGSISDIKKTKYYLLYILERFKKNHDKKDDPVYYLFKKYNITYDEIENLIIEEFENAISDFEPLKISI